MPWLEIYIILIERFAYATFPTDDRPDWVILPPFLCLLSTSALTSEASSARSSRGSDGRPSIGSLLARLSWDCVFLGKPVPLRLFISPIKNALPGEAKKAVEKAVMITA